MGTITVPSVSFPSTATRPNQTICIDDEPIRVNGHDDASGLYQGYLCYLTASTQKNDFTVATDEHGSTAAQAIIYAVELDPWGIHQSYNHADEAYSENDPIVCVQLQVGKKYWLKVSALTVVEGTLYNAVGGTVGAIDDPTPAAVVYNAHCFTSLVSGTTVTGWVPMRYDGLVAIDSTA